jgi:hypothetical protein
MKLYISNISIFFKISMSLLNSCYISCIVFITLLWIFFEFNCLFVYSLNSFTQLCISCFISLIIIVLSLFFEIISSSLSTWILYCGVFGFWRRHFWLFYHGIFYAGFSHLWLSFRLRVSIFSILFLLGISYNFSRLCSYWVVLYFLGTRLVICESIVKHLALMFKMMSAAPSSTMEEA